MTDDLPTDDQPAPAPSQHPRQFAGVWIPASLWLDLRLTPLALVIAVEIRSLDIGAGVVIRDEALAHRFGAHGNDVVTAIRKLRACGLVVVARDTDGTRRLHPGDGTPPASCKGAPAKENAPAPAALFPGSVMAAVARAKPKKAPRRTPTQAGTRMARWFHERLPSTIARPIDWAWRWAITIEDVLRVDGSSENEFYAVVAWAMLDQFYGPQLDTPSYLRKVGLGGISNFSRMRSRMNSNNGHHAPTNNTDHEQGF